MRPGRGSGWPLDWEEMLSLAFYFGALEVLPIANLPLRPEIGRVRTQFGSLTPITGAAHGSYAGDCRRLRSA
jgi:hypothetical protein